MTRSIPIRTSLYFTSHLSLCPGHSRGLSALRRPVCVLTALHSTDLPLQTDFLSPDGDQAEPRCPKPNRAAHLCMFSREHHAAGDSGRPCRLGFQSAQTVDGTGDRSGGLSIARTHPNLWASRQPCLRRLQVQAGRGGCILLGFDFHRPASALCGAAGISDFLALLPYLGRALGGISTRLPNAPIRLTGAGHSILSGRAGKARRASSICSQDSVWKLWTVCAVAAKWRGQEASCCAICLDGGRPAGGQSGDQWVARRLGRAALRRHGRGDLGLFAGPLFDLFRPGRVVIAETDPAEFYTHLGVRFARQRGQRSGKRVQEARAANAPALLAWAGPRAFGWP